MAFLFIWQFLISGPLEVASGLIAMGQFASAIDPEFSKYSDAHKSEFVLVEWRDDQDKEKNLAIQFSPMRWACFGVGCLILFLLYRRITHLGKITITFLTNRMEVVQEGFDAECGFGHNVIATGTYKRVKAAKPKFIPAPEWKQQELDSP